MKPILQKLLVFFVSVLVLGTVRAQEYWVAYHQQVVPPASYQGLRFRLQASVRTELEDDSAAARLWLKIETDKGIGFFDNMESRPIRSKTWTTYRLEGKIDSSAQRIVFGALCTYNGKFFYDDVKLEVETKKGKWVTVLNDDFEKAEQTWQQGIGSKTNTSNPTFSASIATAQAAKGKGCLLIEGKGVPNYGVNKKVGRYVPVNGIQLYYESYGQGPPLLVLHGNGGSIASATPFYPILQKKYKVIAVDSRAQGNSTDTDAELTYEQMAADINALLEHLQLDSALVWGQSDGAILGLILAMDYPRKVKRVLAFGANLQPDSLALFPWAIAAEEKLIKTTKNKQERKLNELMFKHPNIPFSKLANIQAPVLVMSGDRDVIRPEHTLKIFQSIPRSQLCILPGTTHGASWEKQEDFLKILDTFFNQPFAMPTTEDWYK